MMTILDAPLHVPAAPRGAAPDDRLKDADGLGFVAALPPGERAAWWDWARRLRVPDQLAESDPGGFRRLCDAWGAVAAAGWTGLPPRVVDAWTRYLDALRDYHVPGLVIRTLAEHDRMLLRLSGPLLQLAPGMPEELWESAAAFGALDQFWNNLRDMQEDAARGLCWLPEEMLGWERIARADVIAGRAPGMPGWGALMDLWLSSYRASLQDAAALFLKATLPPSLEAMRTWTLRRYARVERVFSAVEYDYRRFPARYWAEARRELALVERAGR